MDSIIWRKAFEAAEREVDAWTAVNELFLLNNKPASGRLQANKYKILSWWKQLAIAISTFTDTYTEEKIAEKSSLLFSA